MGADAADGTPREPSVEVTRGQGTQVGDCNTQYNTFIQPAPAAAPGPVVAGKVPQAPPAFQPREALLSALSEAGPGISVVRAVTGMRGVGKTQVAAAYARRCIDEGWRLVAWVDAEDPAGVLNGLAHVAIRLGVEVPDGTDLSALGVLVRNRLEADGDRCLLVFDNAMDVAGLRPFLPAAGDSQVLVTSTTANATSLGAPVQVDVFTEAEALSFLRERTGSDDAVGARELAEELGCLPLALAQAAAVIAAQRLSYAVYLRRLRSFPVHEYLTPRGGEPYPRGVAESILLSVDAVAASDSTGGLCRDLLDAVSLLSATGVPRDLLYAAAQAGVFTRSGREGSASEQEIDEALAELAVASLLAFSGDGSTVTVHRLVARVCRERLAHDGTLLALGARISALLTTVAGALGEPWRNRSAARETVRQILALTEYLSPHLGGGDTALAKDLLAKRAWVFWCLDRLGDSAFQAMAIGEQLVADQAQMLGEEHPDTLVSRSRLATVYRAVGRVDEAVSSLERTLADSIRVLGEEHPTTLMSRGSLAVAYEAARRFSDAISLHERTLADRVRVLGEEHPDTLVSRSRLATVYRAVGRVDEAIPLLEQTLADQVRVLGEEHPATLASRSNLAAAYRAARRFGEAIPLFERTLADRVRLLGEEHPATLMSRDNLATVYRAVGRVDEAISLHEQALAGFERVLGKSHRSTRKCRRNLDKAYRAATADGGAGRDGAGGTGRWNR